MYVDENKNCSVITKFTEYEHLRAGVFVVFCGFFFLVFFFCFVFVFFATSSDALINQSVNLMYLNLPCCIFHCINQLFFLFFFNYIVLKFQVNMTMNTKIAAFLQKVLKLRTSVLAAHLLAPDEGEFSPLELFKEPSEQRQHLDNP